MLEPLKRTPRKLTHFLCRELLYDYYKGHLDADRAAAVTEYIKKHPELKAELDLYSVAVKYTEKLAQTKVTSGYLIELGQIRPIGAQLVHKLQWRNWPEVLKWTTEAFALSAVVMLAGMLLPWEKFKDLIPDPADPPPMTYEVPSSETTNVKTQAPQTANEPVAADTNRKSESKGAADVAATSATAPQTTTPKVEAQKRQVPTTGYLYSMNMKMKYDPAALELIRNKLVEFGATKAGKVNLGWRKTNPDGSYYHFAMPEIYYRNVVQLLEQYGAIRVYKNQHPRVMPEGQIRVILWIEDAAVATGLASPAPSVPSAIDSGAEMQNTEGTVETPASDDAAAGE